jgi:hypothetical protein
VNFCVHIRGIRDRAANLLPDKGSVLFAQPKDQRLKRVEANLEPIRDIFVGWKLFTVDRVYERFQSFERGCLSLGQVFPAQPVPRFTGQSHRPSGIEDFFRRQGFDRLHTVASLSGFEVVIENFHFPARLRRRARSASCDR